MTTEGIAIKTPLRTDLRISAGDEAKNVSGGSIRDGVAHYEIPAGELGRETGDDRGPCGGSQREGIDLVGLRQAGRRGTAGNAGLSGCTECI